MNRAAWLCVVLALSTAAALIGVFGLHWLTALVAAAIVLACPVVLALTLRESRRMQRELDPPDSRRNHG